MMEDTPANYNQQNQRFDADMDGAEMEDDDEYGSQYEQIGGQGGMSGGEGHELPSKKKKRKKKKKKRRPVEMEDPSLRE